MKRCERRLNIVRRVLLSDSTYFNLALLQLIEDILDSIGAEDWVAGEVELDKIDHDAEAWSGQNEEMAKVRRWALRLRAWRSSRMAKDGPLKA